MAKLAAPSPFFARFAKHSAHGCLAGERLARCLRSIDIMTQARSTIVFGFNALGRCTLSVAGQKARFGRQGLPGVVLVKGA
jgi:hypothetical protein